MLYLSHFALREAPFGLTPDPGFLFPCASLSAALDTLRASITAGEPFVKVTGAAGTGKTLLCRTFLSMLDRAAWVALHVPNPAFEPRALLVALAEGLSLPQAAGLDQQALLKGIGRALLAHARAGKRVVLCLDECQAMPLETLEALRLLTNLETQKRKLFQVVLFGQPELDASLGSPAAGDLGQRISVQHRYEPLAEAEVGPYIAHRLAAAGYAGPPLFAEGAIASICVASQGVPRLVNLLCHKALAAASTEGVHRVMKRHARAAVRELSPEPPEREGGVHETFWRVVAALMLAGVASATWFAYELRPRPPLATNLAYKAVDQGRLSTGRLAPAAAPPPVAPRAAPVLFKLAWTIETPIGTSAAEAR